MGALVSRVVTHMRAEIETGVPCECIEVITCYVSISITIYTVKKMLSRIDVTT